MRTVPFRSPFRPRSLQRGRTGRREGQPGGVLLGATGSDSMCSVSLCSRIWDTASGQCLKTLIGECCWCPLQGTGLCPRRGCLARLPPSLRSTASAPSARAPLPAAPSWCPGPPSSEGRGPLRLRPWPAEPRAPLSALLQPGAQPPPRGAQSGRGGAWRTGSAASACGTGVGGALGTRWGGRFWARAQWSREPALQEWGAAGPAGPGCCCRGGCQFPVTAEPGRSLLLGSVPCAGRELAHRGGVGPRLPSVAIAGARVAVGHRGH